MLLEDVEDLCIGSHKTVKVRCDLRQHKKCRNEYEMEYRKFITYTTKNGGILRCHYCVDVRGDKNPNNKYRDAYDYFDNIDTPDKAYVLGWIASDGTISKSGFQICIRDYDIDVLHVIKDCMNIENPIKVCQSNMVSLAVHSKRLSERLVQLFSIDNTESYKKSHTIKYPNIPCELDSYFIRGFFEGDGCISWTRDVPRGGFASSSLDFINSIRDKLDITNVPTKNNEVYSVEVGGSSLLDFGFKIYENAHVDGLYMKRKYELYESVKKWVPKTFKIRYTKNLPEAVKPFKERASDSGYDLTLIKKIKTDGKIEYYDTGICVKPSYGYYCDLVGRSSIVKSGYMLANGIGVIDMSYRGSIKVPLIKVDDSKPDLKLPIRLVQLVPRRIEHPELYEVDALDESNRGSSGFGSSGN